MNRKNMLFLPFLIATFLCVLAKDVQDQEPTRIFYDQGSYIHRFHAHTKPVVNRVTLTSQEDDGFDRTINRTGMLVQYAHAKANIVICHGFMCDKFDVGFIRGLFPQGEYNFLSFDFRGHGENRKGQCCTFGKNEAFDVIAAANYFKTDPQLKSLPLYVYGFSMGAVASIEAQAKSNPFDAMILDCPFAKSENVVKRALRGLKVSLFGYDLGMPGREYLERYAFHPYVQEGIKFLLQTVAHLDAKNIKTYMTPFSPAESVKKISVPCLFIHCKEDQRVALDDIHTLYNNAQGPKHLWITNGRGHYDSVFYNPEKYSRRMVSFLEQVRNGQIYKNIKQKKFEDRDAEQVVPYKNQEKV